MIPQGHCTFWSKRCSIKFYLLKQLKLLATESLLKMMRNIFYFTLKALFVLKVFKFLSWHFWLCKKRLGKKATVNFKIYDVTNWETNDYNTLNAQYLKKFNGNKTMYFCQFVVYIMEIIFLKISSRKCGGETSPSRFS